VQILKPVSDALEKERKELEETVGGLKAEVKERDARHQKLLQDLCDARYKIGSVSHPTVRSASQPLHVVALSDATLNVRIDDRHSVRTSRRVWSAVAEHIGSC